jgi:hypothetical protein
VADAIFTRYEDHASFADIHRPLLRPGGKFALPAIPEPKRGDRTRFCGPVVHIVFASVWAYHIGIAHVSGRSIVWVAVKCLADGAFLDGCYDFIALGELPAAKPGRETV